MSITVSMCDRQYGIGSTTTFDVIEEVDVVIVVIDAGAVVGIMVDVAADSCAVPSMIFGR